MHFGGWSDSVEGCGLECDGMPIASDPSWKLVDDDGCPHWTYAQGGTLCGTAPPPNVPEAGCGVFPDAAPNDPNCPAVFDSSLCGQSCTFGVTCTYPDAHAWMSCIAAGPGADAGQSTTGTDWYCGN
jgi:hypothetical protein